MRNGVTRGQPLSWKYRNQICRMSLTQLPLQLEVNRNEEVSSAYVCVAYILEFMLYYNFNTLRGDCHDKFGPPFFVPLRSIYYFEIILFGRFLKYMDPMHVVNHSRDSEGSGAGFWV